MENAGRGPTVRLGIVQDAVAQPVAAQHRRGHLVLIRRQRQHSRQAILIKDETVPRQLAGDGRVREVVVKEVVDPPVHRAGVAREQTVFFAAVGDERFQERIQCVGAPRQGDARHAQFGQLEIDVPMKIDGVRGSQSNGTVHGLKGSGFGVLRPWQPSTRNGMASSPEKRTGNGLETDIGTDRGWGASPESDVSRILRGRPGADPIPRRSP